MSETSESYHIRTSDPSAAIKALRTNRFTGLAFPSDAQWLTFVPYGDGGHAPCAILDGLTRHLAAPVLWYSHAQDSGWGLRVAGPGRKPASYTVQWDEEPEGDQPADMIDALQALDLDHRQTQAIGALFSSANIFDPDTPPAYRLAEILKLPASKWLSPHYVTIDTDEYVAAGGKKVGRKPKTNARALPTPRNRMMKFPEGSLTAKAVLALFDPIMKDFGDDWFLYNLNGEVDGNGLTPEGHWLWTLFYTTPAADRAIRINFHSTGRALFEARRIPDTPSGAAGGPTPVPFPDNWIDSPQLTSILESAALDRTGLEHTGLESGTASNGAVMPKRLLVSLSYVYERQPPDLVWDASWTVDTDEDAGTSQRHLHLANAVTGAKIGEQVLHCVDGKVVDETLIPRNA